MQSATLQEMPEETRAQINEWVASKTGGLVKDILSSRLDLERTALRVVVLACQRGAFQWPLVRGLLS